MAGRLRYREGRHATSWVNGVPANEKRVDGHPGGASEDWGIFPESSGRAVTWKLCWLWVSLEAVSLGSGSLCFWRQPDSKWAAWVTCSIVFLYLVVEIIWGSALKIQLPGLHSRPTELEFLGERTENVYFNTLLSTHIPGNSFFFKFNWIIAWQCCVGFCHTLAWISHKYTYVSFLNLPPTAHPTPPL